MNKFLKVGKEFKMTKSLHKVILFLMWKELRGGDV